MNVDEEIKRTAKKIKAQKKILRWMRTNREKLEALPDGALWGAQFDFNNLTHEQTIKVIRTFGGRWKKEPNLTGKVNYSAILDCGVKVRSWASDPPPSCRIVAVEVDVPEVVIAAHKKIEHKLICGKVGAV